MNIDIESLIRQAMNQHMKEMQGEPFKSNDEAIKALNGFIQHKSDIQVGDRVERNDVGRKKYILPTPEMVAICSKVFDEPKYAGNDTHDIEIAVAMAQENLQFFNVDSRYYRKAKVNANVFNFKPASK